MYKIAIQKRTPTIQGDFWKIGRASPFRPRPKKSNPTDTARRTKLSVRFMRVSPPARKGKHSLQYRFEITSVRRSLAHGATIDALLGSSLCNFFQVFGLNA